MIFHRIPLKKQKRIFSYKTFNNFLRLRVFPDEFKITFVTPIFKNGDQYLLANYRPIESCHVFQNN